MPWLSGAERFRDSVELGAAPCDLRVVQPMERRLLEGLLWVGFLRHRHSVSAHLLRSVERRVRFSNEVVAARSVVTRRGDADAQRDVELSLARGQLELTLLRQLAELMGLLNGSVELRVRQQHHEFVSAETHRIAVLARDFYDERSDELESLVSRLVPIGVIDRLEQIDIDHQQRDRKAVVPIPVDLVLEIAMEESTVMESGELVFENEPGGILPYILKKIDELAVLHEIGFSPPVFAFARTQKVIALSCVTYQSIGKMTSWQPRTTWRNGHSKML